ncbi:MAG: hypothetical protein M1825_000515 [Sarcosagium campestre]|nr:MAG: hypothetical protein M1825_000515 [Sarcosagium campestre]
MDVFRILSRSSNLSRSSSNSQKLNGVRVPSNGQAKNPQLFGTPDEPDEEDALVAVSDPPRPLKRKRGAVDTEATPIPRELDFFAEQHSRPLTGSHRKKKTPTQVSDSHTGAEHSDQGQGAKISKALSEEECKKVLRSHKVKITLLTSSNDQSKSGPTKMKNSDQIFPQPLTSFEQLRRTYGISKRVSENIQKQGYRIPTEVQMGSLPLLLDPKSASSKSSKKKKDRLLGWTDLLTVAPTGSGKTLAFLIPVFEGILRDRRRRQATTDSVNANTADDRGVKALIVAPTKELAAQIVNEGRKLALGTGIKISEMRKGMKVVESQTATQDQDNGEAELSESEQSTDASDTKGDSSIRPLVKADVLVATPLLLLNSITIKNSDETKPLPSVKYLVLDEADVLLDPLFRSQTLGIWNACVNESLRVSLWSATMGSSIEAIAESTVLARRKVLSKPSRRHPWQLVRLIVGLKDSAIPNITHQLIYAGTERGKLLGLRQLLHPSSSSSSSAPGSNTGTLRPPFLVFTQTIARATALHSELLYDIPTAAGGSSRLAVLHSALSGPARDAVMARFRAGEVWILITTDLLARGVDFRGLNGVVNYDVPTSGAAYVHRVGRTGRAGRAGGVAVTFYTKEDIPFVKNVANVIAASEKLRGNGRSDAGVQKWLLDALPTPSKAAKKRLKQRGVEARRDVVISSGGVGGGGGDERGRVDGRALARSRISTKSGFDRRVEQKRRGAVEGSRRRAAVAALADRVDVDADAKADADADADADEWGGFDD